MESEQETRFAFCEYLAQLPPLTCGAFMHEALLGPYGYYTTRAKIGGAQADFFTAAASPLFGYTLANHIVQAWRQDGGSGPLRVIEFGPGEGRNAVHIARRLLQRLPQDTEVRMTLVEPSPELAERQQVFLHKFVSALTDSDRRRLTLLWQRHPTKGEGDVYVVANEVLDAFAVESLRRNKGWQRLMVKVEGKEKLVPYWDEAPPELTALADKFLPIPEGTSAEICQQVYPFFQELSDVGTRVRAIFIDYGITTEEWRSGIRPNGTLRGYRNHEICSVFDNAPLCDITADVHWDEAFHAATAAGFAVSPITAQGSFLMKWGIMDVVGDLTQTSDRDEFVAHDNPVARYAGQVKQLVFPGGMGERFAVMECRKGYPESVM